MKGGGWGCSGCSLLMKTKLGKTKAGGAGSGGRIREEFTNGVSVVIHKHDIDEIMKITAHQQNIKSVKFHFKKVKKFKKPQNGKSLTFSSGAPTVVCVCQFSPL